MIFCKHIADLKKEMNREHPEIKPLPKVPSQPPAPDRITKPDKNKPEHPLPEIIPVPSPEIKPNIKQNNINNKPNDR